MPDVYGGLWFENLVQQDRYFDLQCMLYERGLTQGIQLRVAHPCYTPDIQTAHLRRIIDQLPKGMKVFLHFASENIGVDFGQVFDECDVYAQRGQGMTWEKWNAESMMWGYQVAQVIERPEERSYGVIHPGYGMAHDDKHSYGSMIEALLEVGRGGHLVLETVPPVVRRGWYTKAMGSEPNWPHDSYWGFGGTPRQMEQMLTDLGGLWRCFLDITYVNTITVQASIDASPALQGLESFATTFAAYKLLPHSSVCHFSGITDDPAPRHDGALTGLPTSVVEALQSMGVICLEIPWESDTAVSQVERFLEEIAS